MCAFVPLAPKGSVSEHMVHLIKIFAFDDEVLIFALRDEKAWSGRKRWKKVLKESGNRVKIYVRDLDG